LKIKLKGHHFDTSEVIEANSQTVLNTLRVHDFQDAFKQWQKCWEWCIRVDGVYFESDGQLVFDQRAAPPVPEIMDCCAYRKDITNS
jgi:hypothetical protein